MADNITHGIQSATIINPQIIQNELRIRDLDLAQRLGFDRPRDIRKIIKRYGDELGKLGRCATVARRPERGGTPTTEYYLNKKQAIFITAKSETSEATEITIEVIERFDAYESGKVPSPAANYNIPATKAEALRLAADLEDELVIARPKAAALDYISQHAEDIGVRDMGRELHVGQNALVAYLLEHKWACRDGKGRKLKPAHYGLSNGYTRLITTTYTTSSGEVRVTDELRITAKGRTRLAHIFSNKGEAA